MTAFARWLDGTATWQIGLALVLAMLIAAAVGEWVRRRAIKARVVKSDDDKPGGTEGYIVSATLGLLALLMGFTFSLAADRFETRRALVLEEANAIGTTYLRAQMLEPVDRARISRMLVEYTDNRLALARAPQGQIQPLLARNDQMLTDLWTATVAAWPSIKGMDFSSSFLETMNDMIDLDASRKAARQVRVPSAVFFVLFFYVVTSAGVLGYAGATKEGRGATIFLFLLLGVSLMLTLDIDRPTSGRVMESQGPMEALRATLRTQPPEVFDRMSVAEPAAAVSP